MKLNKLTISIILLALVFLSVGVTLTFFNADLFGTRINTLNAGNIVFNYTEGEDTISISNNALSDEEGKTQDTYFDFEVSLESELPETINYNIYLEKDETSTIEDKAIKVYLTNQENELIQDVTKVSSMLPVKNTNRKLIYKTSINSQGPKTIQKYRLRVWLDKDYDLTNTETTDNGQHITISEKTYKFKVGVNNEKISNLSSSWKDKTANEYNFLALYTLDTVELPETYTFETEEYTLDKTADVSEQKNNGVILGEYKSGDKVIAVMGQDGGVIAPQNSDRLFSNYSGKLTVLDLSNFNTSNVTSMSSMFRDCTSLTSLDLSKWDTSNVKNIGTVYYGAGNNYSKYEDFYYGSDGYSQGGANVTSMFDGCTSLKKINIDGWNLKNVSDITGLFYRCMSLVDLSMNGVELCNEVNASYLFLDCYKLENIDLNIFSDCILSGTSYMFYHCSSLTNLDLSPLNTSNVTSMSYMFGNCTKLTNLDLSSLITTNVTNMNSMFYDCRRLASLDLSSFDTNKVTNMGCIFSGCSSLTNLDLSPLNTGNVTNMVCMFRNCNSLTNLDLSPLTTVGVTNMSYMFSGCSSLKSLDLSPLDTGNVTRMRDMFSGCSSLTSLDLSPLDTSNVTNMGCMFSKCSSLTSLDLSPLDTSNVMYTSGMFSGCSDLISLDLSMLDLNKLNDIATTRISGSDTEYGMFYGCTSLEKLDISNMNTTNITNMCGLFDNCTKLITIKGIENLKTDKVINMYNMFLYCSSLTSLDLSNWNTSKVTNMSGMFLRCSSLTAITVGCNWDMTNVTNTTNMFYNCGVSEVTKVCPEA